MSASATKTWLALTINQITFQGGSKNTQSQGKQYTVDMFLVLISLLATAQVVAGICYWPDGSADPSGYECNSTAVAQGGHTSCCLHNDACYESGSCFQDWSGIMYRQSCTDPDWKDPSCPQYCLQKDQLEVGVWIQSCSLQDKKACCVKDAPSASCCNDTSNLFTFTPGYIQAVINGDGTNRLGPYIAADEKAVTAPTSTASTGSEAGSSTDTSAGGTTSLSTPVRDAIIAVGAVLGTILLITLASLVFVWRKFSKERRLRREEQEALRRQQKEIWPQITHEATYLAGGGGVAGGRSEMYAGEFKGARELPASQHVGELST